MILKKIQKQFDAPAEKPKQPQLPKTVEELNAEKDKAFKRGLEKGKAEGKAEALSNKRKEKLEAAGKKVSEFAKKNKKALLIGGGTLATAGVIYGVSKAVKKEKAKKKEIKLKKAVRGYEK